MFTPDSEQYQKMVLRLRRHIQWGPDVDTYTDIPPSHRAYVEKYLTYLQLIAPLVCHDRREHKHTIGQLIITYKVSYQNIKTILKKSCTIRVLHTT